ncbi:MAG: ComEC/Rec2 family competence protein [Bacteroidales bacterium]|nr:ComEC/Rec2 family competence protein [Bacteroidales bacterium]
MTKYPEPLPALLLTGGVAFGAFVWLQPSWVWIVSSALMMIAVLFLTRSLRFGILCCGVCAGLVSGYIHRPVALPDELYGQNREWRGEVEKVYHGRNSQTCVVNVGDNIRIRALICAAAPEVEASDTISFSGQAEPNNLLGRTGVPGLSSGVGTDGPIAASVLADGLDFKIISSKSPGFLEHLADSFSQTIYSSGLNIETAALLCSAWLGTDDVTPRLRQSFRSLGLSHLLCVSGMHVGLVAVLIALLLRPLAYFQYRGRLRYFIIVALVWIYACLTGLQPSAFRAAAMITVFYVVEYFQLGHNSLNTLFLAAAIVIVANPWWIFSIGFQLSVMAVLGIIVLVPYLNPFTGKHAKKYAAAGNALVLPIAVMITTFPIMVYWFASISLVSIFANIIAALIFPVFMFGGLLAAFALHLGCPHIIAALPIEGITQLLNLLCESNPETTFVATRLYISDGSLVVLMLLLCCMLAVVRFGQRRYKAITLPAAVAIMLAVVLIPGKPRREIIVYSSGGHATALICGLEHPLVASTHKKIRPTIPTERYLELQGYHEDEVIVVPDGHSLGIVELRHNILTIGNTIINLQEAATVPDAFVITY